MKTDLLPWTLSDSDIALVGPTQSYQGWKYPLKY
jgi:hypothetical protein